MGLTWLYIVVDTDNKSPIVLVFYDYMLTLSDEIRYVWKSKLSVATVIFYTNRYLIVGMALVNAFGFFPWHTSSVSQSRLML